MPATVLPIDGRRAGAWVLLQAALPGRGIRNIGVFLIDAASGRGWVRLRERFDESSTEDAEVSGGARSGCAGAVAEWARRAGCIPGGLALQFAAGGRAAGHGGGRVSRGRSSGLYGEHVEETRSSRSKRTCRCTACARRPAVWAKRWPSEAGGLGSRAGRDAALAGSVCGPRGGRSMEPRIPDGSLNLFRLHPGGLAAGEDPADRALRHHRQDRAVHGEAVYQLKKSSRTRRMGARAHPAGAAESRI